MVLGGALGPGFVACDARGAAPLCVAGMALRDIYLRFTWQAWHLVTSSFVSRGRRGTNSHLPSFCVAGVALMVLGGALGPGFVACDARGAAPLCVAGVALGDIHLDITWQARHLVTSTFVSRGRRGTNSHLLISRKGYLTSMTPRHFCVHVSRGRRGTISHPRSQEDVVTAVHGRRNVSVIMIHIFLYIS